MNLPLNAKRTALLLSGAATATSTAAVQTFNNNGLGFSLTGQYSDLGSMEGFTTIGSLGSLPGVILPPDTEDILFQVKAPRAGDFNREPKAQARGGNRSEVLLTNVGSTIGAETPADPKAPLGVVPLLRDQTVGSNANEVLDPNLYLGFVLFTENEESFAGWLSYTLDLAPGEDELRPIAQFNSGTAANTQQPDYSMNISSVNVSDTSGESVVVTSAVPETGTSAALLLLGGGALASRQRRKKTAA